MESQGCLSIWIFLVCMLLMGPAQGAKILLLPSQSYSHCLEIGSVGQELANRGHDVAIFLDAKFSHKNCYERGYNGTNKIRPILFQRGNGIKGLDEFQEIFANVLRDGEELSMLRLLQHMYEYSWHQCAAIFADQKALSSIKKEHFDMAIVDGFCATYCYFALPYKLNIMYVTLSTGHEDFLTGRPFLPSIVPHVLSSHTNEMTFFQRLINGIMPIMLHTWIRWNIPIDTISSFAPELSAQGVINLVSKSELFLYNYDTVLSYPVPTMPNHVLVGGVGAYPAAPLSGIFKEIYQNSADGVVLVSFGSIASSLSSSVEVRLTAVFEKLNIDVLWKFREADHKANVKRVKWFPQNDLLGHPNTRLFVSHCGNNGVFEALYHGVPLVCTPLAADQFYNGVRVEKWKVGLSIPIMTSSEETLFNAIYEVLNNPIYKTNMMKASEIYHSRPENARERAAFWIEHVLKFGGDHLRSQASDMSVFTYLGYDVFCFILLCSILILLVITKSILLICRRCCCREKTEKVKTS